MPSESVSTELARADVQIGALGYGALARVGEHGTVQAGDLALEWWVGADDRWHVPAQEITTRQQRPFAAPVVETMVRVPSGDAVHRVYAAAAGGGAVTVVEIENRSPAPFTAALVVGVARRASIELDGTALRVGGEVVLVLPRAPGAWAVAPSTREMVMSGGAHTRAFEPTRGPIEVALLFPVAHRTTWRGALTAWPIDVRALPGADSVARGWDLQLERGMRAELPPPLGVTVDAARADLLLAPTRPDVVAALEDWGFDAEAATGWSRLGWSGRRRARKRIAIDDPWAATVAVDARAEPVRLLANLRSVLVREQSDAVDLLPGFSPDWLGQSISVDAVPVRAGVISFALRWHGHRPALLWEASAGVKLRIPVLDPEWSSSEPEGEVLLAMPPVVAPGQFS